jgi:hypothetical protein
VPYPSAEPCPDPGALDGQIDALAAFPSWLAALARDFTEAQARVRPAPGAFALVEHAHHLLDLERESHWVRLRRLLASERPFLPDLDGDALARTRQYLVKPLWPGVTRFSAARAASVELLRSISPAALSLPGELEGVGPVTIAGLVGRWAAHDAGHRAELEALRRAVLGRR